MGKINNKIKTIKFPEDLSEYRYVAIEFFIPEGEERLNSLVSNLKKAGVTFFRTVGGRQDITLKEVKNILSNLWDNSKATLDAVVDQAVYVLTTTQREEFNKKKLQSILYLPLPNTIADNFENQYSSNDSGPISGFMNKIGDNKLFKDINSLTNSLGMRNLKLNADLNLLYTGSNLRKLTMTWTFTPRNKDERKTILDIIKTLRIYSSPDDGISRSFLKAPSFVNVILSNPDLQDLQRYHNMVVEALKIDYGSSGNMETFLDGMVKEIIVSITLSELRLNTKSDWEKELKEEVEK